MNHLARRIFLLLAIPVFASMAFGADLAGLWECPKPNQKLTIKHDGDKLTGMLQSALGVIRIAEAKVEGNNVTLTFFVILNNGKDPLGLAAYDAAAEEGQVTELTYKGTISGADMKVKVSQERLGDVSELTFHKSN